VLEEKLDASAAVIVLMTPRAWQSDWVQSELARAKRKHKPLFPLLLEGDLWLSVEATQCADVRNGALPPEDFYGRLARTVLHPTAATQAQEAVDTSPPAAGPAPASLLRFDGVYVQKLEQGSAGALGQQEALAFHPDGRVRLYRLPEAEDLDQLYLPGNAAGEGRYTLKHKYLAFSIRLSHPVMDDWANARYEGLVKPGALQLEAVYLADSSDPVDGSLRETMQLLVGAETFDMARSYTFQEWPEADNLW
jgi:hypothetical protein